MAVANPSPELAAISLSFSDEDPYLAPDEGRRVSLEDYWEHWYEHPDHNYEWNNGILEGKAVPNAIQTKLYRWYFIILGAFVDTLDATIAFHDIGFLLTIPDPKNPGKTKRVVRKPDQAVILPDNPVQWVGKERSYKGVFDLVVEVISDSHKRHVTRDTKTKRQEYQDGSVREYHILDAREGDKNEQTFLYATKKGVLRPMKPDKDGVLHSKALKGFRFRLEDLVRQPTLEEMMGDPVYDYVLPATVAKLAEKDESLAEKDEALAEKDEALAEKDEALADKEVEIAKLRAAIEALGKNPDDLLSGPAE